MNWHKAKKPARIAAVVVGGLVALVALVVVSLLLLQPVRNRALDFALNKAGEALPGTITVDTAEWPSPGTLEIDGFVWIDGPDTLAAVGRLEVSVKLHALLSRDVHITNLAVEEALADVPAITRRFAGEQPPDPETEEESGGGFPRDGALPRVPSIAVDHLQLEARYLKIAEAANLENIRIRGAVNLLHGVTPVVQLDELTLTETTNRATVDSLWLTANLSTLEIVGKGWIQFRLAPDIYLDCFTGDDHNFNVLLTTTPGSTPPEAPGIVLTGQAELENGRLQTVEFHCEFLTPGSEGLAQIEPVARLLADLPVELKPMEGIGGRINGKSRITPKLSASATFDLFRTSWLDTVHAAVTYNNNLVTADSLLLALPGLRLDVSGETGQETGSTLRAKLNVAGTRWLTNIVSGVSLPDTLSAAVVVDANGFAGGQQTNIDLVAGGFVNGFTLDSLVVNALLPDPTATDQPLVLDLNGNSMGLQLLTHVELTLPPDNEPIRMVFSEHPDPVTDRTIAIAGEMVYAPAARSVTVSDLLLSGAVGNLSANARLDSLMRGPIDFTCEWSRPPAALLAVQAVDSAAFEALALSWEEDGPFELSANGLLDRAGEAIIADVSGRLYLPGPGNLAALADPGVSVDDLGPVSGSFSINSSECRGETGIKALLDLGETAWLDTAQVSATVCGGSINIDSLRVLFEGLRVYAQGGRSVENWDLQASISLADSQLVRRLEAGMGSKLNMSLDVTGQVTGPAESPEINGIFHAGVKTPQVGIPSIDGHITLGPDSLVAELNTPDGVTSSWVVADNSHLEYRAGRENNGLATGKVKIEANGPDLELLFSAWPLVAQ